MSELRIIPMIASATEMVHALGLGGYQVGRSHECDYPETVRGLPVCTRPRFNIQGDSREIDARVKQSLAESASVYEVLTPIVNELRPTHLLTQTQCEVCAVSLRDVERAMSEGIDTRPLVVALEPNCLADIWNDFRRIAAACGVPERGDTLVAEIQGRMEAVAALTRRSGRRPRTACIEWPEPLMSAGNWVPELVEMLGAVNLFGEAGRHSPWMTFESLAAADPDVIICLPCGYDLPTTHREMHWLTSRPAWPHLAAVRNRQVFLCDGNQFLNRPGPRVAESLEILAEILFPGVMASRFEGVGWQRF
jgi:iron complex transport system substrate-binding protein